MSVVLEAPDAVDLGGLDLLATELRLTETDEGWIAPRDESAAILSIADLSNRPGVLRTSAVAELSRSLRDRIRRETNWVGLYVAPSPEDIDLSDGLDLRPAGDLMLEFRVYIGTAVGVRSIASGDRFRIGPESGDDAIDRPEHRGLVLDVPVTIGLPVREAGLNDYALRKSRHPGRRVDVALAPADQLGGISVDLLIDEAKPWTVFYQLANTGTENTSDWRHRFGFQHRQLTGRDDILSLDYITAGFEDSHALLASYEFPVITDTLRLRAFGSWNEYTASDVGLPGFDFNGDGFDAGGEAIWNVAQSGAWFIDLVGGARVEHAAVDNEFAGTEASEEFFLLSGGVRASYDTPLARFSAEGVFDGNIPGVFGTDEQEVAELGRTDADADFTVLRGAGAWQFWLDPLFGATETDDPDKQTLSSEIEFSVRGQWALGDRRLPPTFQAVAGGRYTVRGYHESFSAGDNLFLATAEYRFHLGRALPASAASGSPFGGPFRVTRDRPYGLADWDLILRAFVDVARVEHNDRLFFERNSDLLGVGVGVELQLLSNLSARLDYGVAAWEATNGVDTTDRGDARLHFEFTALY